VVSLSKDKIKGAIKVLWLTGPHIIEDKLLQAAGYFETQIIGFFDGRSADEHARLKLLGKNAS
jgi:hypothetical protein